MALWGRLRPGALGSRTSRMTRAAIALLADMVPPAIARAAGLVGGGVSLDNSLRFGTLPDDVEWVLLELRGHMASGSHGHGSVRIWTEDGRLVAVGGQSANMRYAFGFDTGPDGPGSAPAGGGARATSR